MKRSFLAAVVAAVPVIAAGAAFATSDAAELPPHWHVHDGRTALGTQHKGIGFFPAILGVSTETYLEDPAACPDATDKAFLPQGRQDGQSLRAGVCQTSDTIIHLRSVPTGTAGPAGWESISSASEPGWVTYYTLTAR